MRDARLTYLEHCTSNLVSCISYHVSRIYRESRIPYPTSRITYHASRIPHPASLIAYLASCLLSLLLCAPSSAHEARPAYLEIKETALGQFSVLWRTPVLAGMRLPVVLKIPDDVKNLKEPVVHELADSLVERRSIDAGPNGLAGKRIEFVGLQLTITDALVRVELLDGRKWTTIARPSQPWVEIAASQTWWEVMGTYIVEGIRHILFGADHLLFVLGLLLIVKDRWMLLKTVTAFTVAHSITLAIATLGYAEAPALPLNAAIALSILFLGPEIVKQNDARSGIRDTRLEIRDTRFEIRDMGSEIRDTRTSHPASLTIRYPWVVAFAFGLLHGFGFASALTSAGLPRSELPLALVSFNVGVELGQLGFIALVLALERSFRVLEMGWPHWVQVLPGYTVGSLGAFWTVQRVAMMIAA
jgi:HupE / UreJ protein